MSKQMKKTIFGILGGIVLMLLIAYLPPETEMMSRQGWQYLGCFGFLLTCLISGALPDWVATLATMVMLLVFKLGKRTSRSSSPARPSGCASACSSCRSASTTAAS